MDKRLAGADIHEVAMERMRAFLEVVEAPRAASEAA